MTMLGIAMPVPTSPVPSRSVSAVDGGVVSPVRSRCSTRPLLRSSEALFRLPPEPTDPASRGTQPGAPAVGAGGPLDPGDAQ